MKTNLLAQNDNLVIENLKADVGKSVMDLSHSTTFPVDVDGAIYPICCIETVPSDSFEINVECLLRQLSPLKVPLMTNLRLNTAFYYCDNRLAWKKWDRFMTGGRSGNELYDIPRVANIRAFPDESNNAADGRYLLADVSSVSTGHNNNYNNTIHTYLGISMNIQTQLKSYSGTSLHRYGALLPKSIEDELPVAFPFFDYQLICRDYYTNIDRLPQNVTAANIELGSDPFNDWSYNNLFPSDDDEIRLVDGIQLKSGFNSGDDPVTGVKGFYLDKIRYHDVRPDYFTTSKKAPMRGDAPSLTSVSTLVLPNGTTLTIKNTSGVLGSFNSSDVFEANNAQVQPMTGTGPLRDLHAVLDSDGKIALNGATSGADVGYPVDANLKDITGIKGTTVGDLNLTGSLSTNLTAADIRLLSQLTVWQELNMLHEPYYNDFLNAHFDGVRVGESPVEKPQYIGGTSQLISINEILQTSQTTTGDTGSPLGNQGATAMSLANNHVGKYYCNNYGYIIGVAYIVPEMMYKPAMPRGFSRRTKEDYYSPEFANLSMQATLNKEIFFSNDEDWNNAPWGYTGAFDELRSIPNRIAGDLLNSSYTDLQKWVLTREMANDNLPAMESKWLSLKDNVDKTAWAVQTMPVFMLQCANYIKAVRPMPKVAIPKAL